MSGYAVSEVATHINMVIVEIENSVQDICRQLMHSIKEPNVQKKKYVRILRLWKIPIRVFFAV